MTTLLDEVLEERETATADFPESNECWRPGAKGKADWSRIILKVEATLVVPDRCADPLTARLVLRDVVKGGASDWADAVRFGVSDGSTIGGLANASRVSEKDGIVVFEHVLPRRGTSCTAFADTFVYVKFPADGRHAFIEVGYYPRLSASGGKRTDHSPPPAIRLDPCDNLKPIRAPYIPGAASRAYQRLSTADRAAVAKQTNERFRKETAVRRTLRPGDLLLMRHWLRIRDALIATRP